MKKVMNKIKINIYFWTVLFVLVSIIVQFVLYLFDIRFRLVVIFVILIGTFLGFALGILQQIFSSFDKKMILLKSVGALILWVILFVLFMPFCPYGRHCLYWQGVFRPCSGHVCGLFSRNSGSDHY